MKHTLGIVLVLVAMSAFANQHDEKKAMAPDPMRQLDPLVGKWQCKGMAYATPCAELLSVVGCRLSVGFFAKDSRTTDN